VAELAERSWQSRVGRAELAEHCVCRAEWQSRVAERSGRAELAEHCVCRAEWQSRVAEQSSGRAEWQSRVAERSSGRAELAEQRKNIVEAEAADMVKEQTIRSIQRLLQ
jgi:hypothetical protein